MSIPIDDIIQSVQILPLIKEQFIRQGEFILDKRGRPIHYSGGYAVVFPVIVNGEKWAFRCWSAELKNIGKRVQTISSEFKKNMLPYFCDYTFSEQGIVVNGKIYPTTRMRWIEGLTLKDYLNKNYTNSSKIYNLADNFFNLCKGLHEFKIAHGDLQHGNIMVNNSDNLYLIDYDSIYVPSLQGEVDIISGIADYQHPARKNNRFSHEKLDYFSELIIYTSILAIANNPELMSLYNINNSEKLLFSSNDYLNIRKSRIYKDLKSLGGIFNYLLAILEEYLSYDDISNLFPFEDRLNNDIDNNSNAKIKEFKSEPNDNKESIPFEQWLLSINSENKEETFQIIKKSLFSKRRKKIRNSVKQLLGKGHRMLNEPICDKRVDELSRQELKVLINQISKYLQ